MSKFNIEATGRGTFILSVQDVEPFFPSSVRTEVYEFESWSAANQYALIMCSEREPIELSKLNRFAKAAMKNLNMQSISLPYSPRSKYEMNMLRESCAAWMAGGRYEGFDGDKLAYAIKLAGKKWKLASPVEPWDTLDVWEYIRKDANSGLPWVTKTKSLTYKEVKAQSDAWLDGKVEPYTAFPRGKNLKEVRLVQGQGKGSMLVGGQFYYPYIKELQTLKDHPFAAGLRNTQQATRVNMISRQAEFVGLWDYSKFDSSIPRFLIHAAFKIVKKNLSLSAEQRREFDAYVEHFVSAPTLMPDGKLYWFRNHGVPSGDLFTSLIDSIVNTIVIYYLALKFGWNITHIIALGDDSMVGFGKPVTESRQQIADGMKELGINLNMKKTKGNGVVKGGDRAHFLGHEWFKGIQTRELEETLERLFYPETIESWMRYSQWDTVTFYLNMVGRINDYINDNLDFWYLGNEMIRLLLAELADQYGAYYGYLPLAINGTGKMMGIQKASGLRREEFLAEDIHTTRLAQIG